MGDHVVTEILPQLGRVMGGNENLKSRWPVDLRHELGERARWAGIQALFGAEK